MTRKLIIPGGSGYLGRHVAAWFQNNGWDVTVIARSPRPIGVTTAWFTWDGRTLGPWAKVLDGAEVVLNLAGRTVNCRYTEKNKHEIYDSRLASTRVIGEAIAAAASPPKLWMNAASATIYRHAEDRPMDEVTGDIGDGFSVGVCRKWEAEFFNAKTPDTVRRVALRAAMVMGPGDDGVFGAFYGITKKGLGGTLGSGRQYVSWVHLEDFCRALMFLIDHPQIDGVVNLASPNPIPNRQFMRELRQAAGVRIGLPATRWMLKIGAFFLRTETELLLKSRRVVPRRLSEAGFDFVFPDWVAAARDILARHVAELAPPQPAAPKQPVTVQGLEPRSHV